MRRLVGVVLAAAAAAAPLQAQDTRPGIAVLPFEDAGSYGQDKENFEALRQGIPAMLSSELGRNPAARLVDRSATQRLLPDRDPGGRGRVDAATAAALGKRVGARYVIIGSFVDFYGKCRIDARVVDAESGEILEVVSVGPQERAQLFRMIQTVAQRIMGETKLPPLPDAVAAAAKARVVPTDALTYYGRALLHQDRGETARAVEFYQRALEAFPDYAEAREGLRRARS